MVHRSVYPRRRWPRFLWLIWMALMVAASGAIAIILALVAGFGLVVAMSSWLVSTAGH